MVVPENLQKWMDSRGFSFRKLVVDGIDNGPVLAVNKPEMTEEEICLFHERIKNGTEYVELLQAGMERSQAGHLAYPVVRFADGEYAFYADSLECNGLYRQAESVRHIREALPLHVEALRALAASGILAPLVFPGNLSRRKGGLFSFIRKEKPSASTFLAFLDRNGIELTAGNYIPFYAIYAWLTSARFARHVDGQKVCIVNADWNEQAVRSWFEGFSSHPELTFVDLPPEYVATQWPSQRHDVLSRIPSDASLCLVGAGVGALLVCVDVARACSIPAIDAGHALNMMNDRIDKSNGARLYTLWKTP